MRELNLRPIFAGRPASMEQELAAKVGFEFFPLSSSGFFGKGLAAKFGAVWNVGRGTFQALALMRREQPAAVVAAGGFGSVPSLLAAQWTHRDYFLLEQNCIPGRVTRHFAPGAREVYVTFPLDKPLKARTVFSGTPLRKELVQAASLKLQATSHKPQGTSNTVLVLGGSLGARALNYAAIELAQKLPELHFIIQTGRRDYPDISRKVGELNVKNIELFDFTLAMQDYYVRADLVLSRAGGMVINEILAFGLPSVLVPFPFATDNHQQANAMHAAREGASLQIDQSRLPELADLIRDLCAHPKRLAEMAANARRIARPNAAREIAERIKAQVER
jgi:UDP-N-acetylglucosamine--N-acetylmuramyl-(pentapeptide) pyrophosphoryl-undecaprenol N-acetylglucosamine transferase